MRAGGRHRSQQAWRFPNARCMVPSGGIPTRLGRRVAGSGPSQPLPQTGRERLPYLIALACCDAPKGHDHRLLSAPGGLVDQLVELGVVESLSCETVCRKPWRKQQRCIPKVCGEFVAVMDLYAEHYDPRQCRQNNLVQRARARIWQMARNEAALLAYRVATPRHCLKFKNAFSTK